MKIDSRFTFHDSRYKPDGTPRKLLDVSKLKGLGWRPEIDLQAGLIQTIECFYKNLLEEKLL